jgi:IstB-like ATP binding protein
MILTSNRGFSEWEHVFGDPVVATALLDRLLHHATVIQIEGASIPISCRKTSGQKAPSNHCRSRQLSNVAAGRPKTELSINTTADHLARQTGEFYWGFRAPLTPYSGCYCKAPGLPPIPGKQLGQLALRLAMAITACNRPMLMSSRHANSCRNGPRSS